MSWGGFGGGEPGRRVTARGGGWGLDECGPSRDKPGDDAPKRRLDSVEDRSRIDAQQNDQNHQRGQARDLVPADGSDGRSLGVAVRPGRLVGVVVVRSGFAERSEQDFLEHQEQVVSPQDHSDGGEHGGDRRSCIGSQQDREFADEPVETRDRSRAERGQDQEEREQRESVPEPAKFAHLAGVISLVEHPDAGEESPGGDPVVDHLDDRPLDPDRVEREQSEDDETHMADR